MPDRRAHSVHSRGGRRQSMSSPPQPALDCPGDRPPAPRDGRPAGLHAGQDGARRDQDRQQRDRRRPLPSVRAAIARPPTASTATRTTATPPSDRLAKHVGLRARAHRGGLRFGEPVPAADPDHLRRRRRGDVRLAQLRDLPAAGPHRGRDAGAGSADRPHLRPGRHAGRRSPTAPG